MVASLRLTLVALAAVLGTVAQAQLTPEQIAENIPQCAKACIKDAAPVVGCVETNYRCQCEKAAGMNEEAYPCLEGSCGAEDLQTAKVITLSICEALRMQDLASRTAPISPTNPPPGANPADNAPSPTPTASESEAEPTTSPNAAPLATGVGVLGVAALVVALL